MTHLKKRFPKGVKGAIRFRMIKLQFSVTLFYFLPLLFEANARSVKNLRPSALIVQIRLHLQPNKRYNIRRL